MKPAVPTFSIRMLLIVALRATPSIYYKARIFSFADMLPVKVFMNMLYNRATQLADRGPNPDLSSVSYENKKKVITCFAARLQISNSTGPQEILNFSDWIFIKIS